MCLHLLSVKSSNVVIQNFGFISYSNSNIPNVSQSLRLSRGHISHDGLLCEIFWIFGSLLQSGNYILLALSFFPASNLSTTTAIQADLSERGEFKLTLPLQHLPSSSNSAKNISCRLQNVPGWDLHVLRLDCQPACINIETLIWGQIEGPGLWPREGPFAPSLSW